MKTRIRQQTTEQKMKTWVNDVQLEVPNNQILVFRVFKKEFQKVVQLICVS